MSQLEYFLSVSDRNPGLLSTLQRVARTLDQPVERLVPFSFPLSRGMLVRR